MAEKTPRYYVFHGEDDYTLHLKVNEFRHKSGDELNTAEFDGAKTSVGDVLAAAQVMPFLSDKRLVIVHDMLSYLTRKGASKESQRQLEQLVSALSNLPEFTRLAFVERQTLSSRHPVIQLAATDLSGFGFVREFSPPNNPAQWIKSQAENTYGVKIEPRAINALVSLLSRDKKVDLHAADNEVAKLALYVGENGTISEAVVQELTPYVSETSIFPMVDALGQRDGKTAMQLAHRLLADQTDPLALLSMVVRQFRLLIQVYEGLEQRLSPQDLAAALGLQGFVVSKLTAQARRFSSLEELEAIYRALLETDVAIKTGKVTPELSIDLLIAGLTAS